MIRTKTSVEISTVVGVVGAKSDTGTSPTPPHGRQNAPYDPWVPSPSRTASKDPLFVL